MKKICKIIVIAVFLPVAIITYPIWGIAYYKSVIN